MATNWRVQFERRREIWVHNGSDHTPHLVLPSGLHSDGFFDVEGIKNNDSQLALASIGLLTKLSGHIDLCEAGGVVGHQHLAEPLSNDITRRTHGSESLWVSPIGESDEMSFCEEDAKSLLRRTVIICDFVASAGRIKSMADAVLRAGGLVLPYALVLLNPMGYARIDDDMLVISLVNQQMNRWEPQDCPLCKMGSSAVSTIDS